MGVTVQLGKISPESSLADLLMQAIENTVDSALEILQHQLIPINFSTQFARETTRTAFGDGAGMLLVAHTTRYVCVGQMAVECASEESRLLICISTRTRNLIPDCSVVVCTALLGVYETLDSHLARTLSYDEGVRILSNE